MPTILPTFEVEQRSFHSMSAPYRGLHRLVNPLSECHDHQGQHVKLASNVTNVSTVNTDIIFLKNIENVSCKRAKQLKQAKHDDNVTTFYQTVCLPSPASSSSQTSVTSDVLCPPT